MRDARSLTIALVAMLALLGGAAARADVAPPTAVPPPPDGVIAQGVTVGGVPVAGLTQEQARASVQQVYLRDVVLELSSRIWHARAAQLGLHVYVDNPVRAAYAVGRSPAAQPGDVPVVTRLAGHGLLRFVRSLAASLARAPADARLVLRGGRPHVLADAWGRRVDVSATAAALAAAARDPSRPVVQVVTTPVRAQVTSARIGPAIVIDRGAHSLTLFAGERVVRRFGVAVGQPAYPTPTGRFAIVDMQANPWWYPPNSSWAAGEKPVPPGPGNPLGTRWMGLSAPGVGIHGTPDAASIGYSASHGCIRMHIPDAEWLFAHVRVGASVWIVD
jgi:lipoprotein-anchoring transpeptidase ErfK/SrfK